MQHLYWKQIIIILVCVIISYNTFSQISDINRPEDDYQRVNLGINYGLSKLSINYKLNKLFINEFNTPNKINKIQYSQNTLITLGLFAKFRINNKLKIRGELNMMVGDKGISNFKINNDTTNYNLLIGAAILNIPVNLIYQSDRYDAFNKRGFMRHYIFAGSKIDIDFTNTAIKFYKSYKPYDGILYPSFFKNSDLGYELGFGVSFYLRYATLSPEIKFSNGFYDIRKQNLENNLLNNINTLNINNISFTLRLEN